ncbi:hypothetical protein WDZ17_00340 [Pseudokineococcus basanitobsidens]|uniref:Uncharacterized protein n=1 Tax=Pseudokineococcus basanitobsidens TaxID=1926649 RepID=A0ABU8RF83_9ACTN
MTAPAELSGPPRRAGAGERGPGSGACTFVPLLVAEPSPPLGWPAPDAVVLPRTVLAAVTAAPGDPAGPLGPPAAGADDVPTPRRPVEDVPPPPRVPAQPSSDGQAPPRGGREQRRDPELRRAFGALLRDLTGSEVLTQQAVGLLRAVVDRSSQREDAAPDEDAVAAAALLDDLGHELAAAQARLAEAERAHTEEQLERALAEAARGEAERRLRDLQRRVRRSGVDVDVWSTAPSDRPEDRAEDVPASMAELLARLRLPQLERVVFTGDAGPALELDAVVHTGLHLQRTWEGLLALRDYAAAKADGRWDADVHGYLERTPEGMCTFPASRHARGESTTVQNDPRLRAPRLLPVPDAVDPSGRAFMGAHLRLLTYGQTSPRLHYLDDTRRTGCVYVGYVGRHLPNTQTS